MEEPDGVKVGEIGGGIAALGDGEDAIREYEEKRDRLAKAIESSLLLLADLRNFNEREWTIRYPLMRPGGIVMPLGEGDSVRSRGEMEVRNGKGKGKGKGPERPNQLRRTVTMTLADDPLSTPHSVSISSPPSLTTLPLTGTSASTSTPEVSHTINSVGAIDEAAIQTGREGAQHAIRKGMKRSVTLIPGSMTSVPAFGGSGGQPGTSIEGTEESTPNEFSILRLDLSLGHETVSNITNGIMSSLNRNSISSLISNRITQSLAHLQLLQQRISSTSSRVLVTGDLNAGKSTLVNALLRRGDEVMPVDQQPLTGRFVEVFGDAEIGTLEGVQKGLREEVHVPRVQAEDSDEVEAEAEGEMETRTEEEKERKKKDKGKSKEVIYDRTKEETYERKQLQDLYELVLDQEATSPPLKVYLRPPYETRNPSILHNGILDISLIDAPGLNRDVLQTTSNFASSSSIDVIVFVVSAANHFTLSAKEFILSAGQEKARMFIVVNRFDEVRDKERCKRLVLEQIKRLSPGTYEERDELVHFVDSAKVAYGCFSKGGDGQEPGEGSGSSGGGSGGDGDEEGDEDDFDEAFKHLEQSLRSFVLINRAKSKLGPAETYLTHLMADVDLLAGANAAVAEEERDKAREELARIRPILDVMKRGRDGLDDGLEEEEDRVAQSVAEEVRSMLTEALDNIGRGRLATNRLSMPGYPGLLGAWDYAAEVRRVMLQSIEMAVAQAENQVRKITSTGVAKVTKLGDIHLPKDVERSKRVFNADAMFAVNRRSTVGPGDSKRAQLARRRSTNFGTVGLDLGLTSRQDLLQVAFTDIFDFQHLFLEVKPSKSGKATEELDGAVSPWGMASVAAGAVTVFGGQALGLKTLLRNAAHVWDILGDESARRFVAPAAGAILLGLTLYVVHDLPASIPRNVGRQLHLALLSLDDGVAHRVTPGPYSDQQTIRMQREARKVIRLASWDLRERFKAALEARGHAVEECEVVEKRAEKAVDWFREVEDRVVLIRQQMKQL